MCEHKNICPIASHFCEYEKPKEKCAEMIYNAIRADMELMEKLVKRQERNFAFHQYLVCDLDL